MTPRLTARVNATLYNLGFANLSMREVWTSFSAGHDGVVRKAE